MAFSLARGGTTQTRALLALVGASVLACSEPAAPAESPERCRTPLLELPPRACVQLDLLSRSPKWSLRRWTAQPGHPLLLSVLPHAHAVYVPRDTLHGVTHIVQPNIPEQLYPAERDQYLTFATDDYEVYCREERDVGPLRSHATATSACHPTPALAARACAIAGLFPRRPRFNSLELHAPEGQSVQVSMLADHYVLTLPAGSTEIRHDMSGGYIPATHTTLEPATSRTVEASLYILSCTLSPAAERAP